VACWAAVAAGSVVRGAFVDHRLAGSPLLDAAAAALCDRLGVTRTVLDGAVADGPDLERRARDIRYRALRGELAPDELLVTGHTMTDQAETVILQLMRGAGSRGLAAMAGDDGRTIRPLLAWSRDEMRTVAVDLDLPFADDPGNDEQRFTRNRVRADVMPLLAAIKPGSEAAIARAADALAADDAHLQREAAEIPVAVDEGAVLLPAPVLATVDRAVAARAVLAALRRVQDTAGTSRDVAAVLDLVSCGRRRAQLSGGRFAEIEGPHVALWAVEPSPSPPVAATVPGTTTFGAHRIHIRRQQAASQPLGALVVDAAAIADAAAVRAVMAGDRIAIRGGTKLVNDALAECGVPRRLRRAWPVVVADGKIAAVPGARVAWWARATGAEALTVTDERVTG
jgi:tRNA(Ile)-lysidine synthase